MHSERFVQDMVKIAKQTIEEFKRYYRSVDALFIDDIQFLPIKTIPRRILPYLQCLIEGNHQIILTSDRYPKRSTVLKTD